MSWFADLAGKAESLLNNLDEQTGAALRNHTVRKSRHDRIHDFPLHPEGNQKKRPVTRNFKKNTPITETKSSFIPSRKSSPTQQSRSQVKETPERNVIRNRKSSPSRKSPQYHLNNCPKTLVNDVPGDNELMHQHKCKGRRFSLPTEIDMLNSEGDWGIDLENLEVENTMLKNELNVMNREISDLVDKIKYMDDGNHVDSDRCHKELNKTRMKLDRSELQNHKAILDKNSMACQLDMLKERIDEISSLRKNYQDERQLLANENVMLKETNNELENRIKEMLQKLDESSATQHKLETELRHAQTTISELQGNLTKANDECQRLEKDWETYKLRVKSMLHTKDNEIKALQDGFHHSEDTKVLVEQLNSLKEERDELSDAISSVRNECESLKQYMSQLESRYNSSECVVSALREALKEERAARNKAEGQCHALAKELKTVQTETGQTIASLRTALRDKDHELNHLRDTASSVKTTDTSALNVADYGGSQDIFENEKIHYLTETLVQRQCRIDKLLAENNTLKIQLDKLDSKLKQEQSHRNNHSVVNVQNDVRTRRAHSDSVMNVVSYRMGAVIRRHPLLRIFVIIYMIGLHFWVLTVLLTSTPAENFIPKRSRPNQ